MIIAKKNLFFALKEVQMNGYQDITFVGKTTAIQTMTLLMNSAHCTYASQLNIESPNNVYFCNDIDIYAIPLLDPKVAIKPIGVTIHTDKRQKAMLHPTHIIHHRDMHYTIGGDKQGTGRHKRKKASKQKIAEMKLLEKRARRRHHPPEKVVELPIAQRKLLCKYRKSCYESGIIPMEKTAPKEPETQSEEETEQHEISDAEIKLACKYRKSCYAEFGHDESKRPKPKKHKVLTGKARAFVHHHREKKSLKEIAHKALETVKHQETKIHRLPEQKKAIVEKKLNETEMKKIQKSCKYRKSCYTTGIPPKLASKYEFLMKIISLLPKPPTEETKKNFTEFDDLEKKTFCHYRKSCYDSGVRPTLKNATQLKIKHVIKKEEQQIPLQLRCKYRKSCYETKVLPTTEPPEVKEPEEEFKPLPVIETLMQLKAHCKYRKSCYQQKLDDHEREEFLKNMSIRTQIPEKRIQFESDKAFAEKEAKEEETDKSNVVESTEIRPTTESQEEIEDETTTKDETIERKKEKEIKNIVPKPPKVKRPKREDRKPKVDEEQTVTPPKITEKPKKEEEIQKTRKIKGNYTLPESKRIKSDAQRKKEQVEPVKSKIKKSATEKRSKIPSVDQEELKRGQKESKERKESYRDESKEPSDQPTKKITKEPKSKPKEKPTKKLKKFLTGKVTGDDGTGEKLSCKYRKSCYGKGSEYDFKRDFAEQITPQKSAVLQCKYKKSCPETEIKPEIDRKSTPKEEDLANQIDTEAESEKPSIRAHKKLYCKYRKSCYATGKIPILKKVTLKNLAVTDPDTVPAQLRCRYRKSCYKKANILLDTKTAKMKKTVKREDAVSDATISKVALQAKGKLSEEKRKTGAEKKLKKDEEKKSEEEEDREKDETKKKPRDEDKEEQYKQIKVTEPQLQKKRTLSAKEKLSCKYRKRCYEGQEIIHFKPQKISLTMKGLKRADGKPCNIYYISCRKMVGLPIRQRPPIGPSGKRLCRKKPKNANAST